MANDLFHLPFFNFNYIKLKTMSNTFDDEKNHEISRELKCNDCGALLKYAPGTEKLACKYCGAQNEIKSSETPFTVDEIEYEEFVNNKINQEEKQTISTVKCTNCGASTTLKPNVTADNCAFCASPLVIQNGTTSTIIKPKYVLPFKIDDAKAHQLFNQWINGLWFAPNDLKKQASLNEKLKGLYLPYWTYDSNTTTEYSGERGEYYYIQEGKNRVRKTKWYATNGTYNKFFDDVCVIASNTLPSDESKKLEPWDLKNLVPYDEKYISGFQAECYQLDVRKGLNYAKKIMQDLIDDGIRQQIGGDDQRIDKMHIVHNDISFKHILLPIWISAYQYKKNTYHFIINGRNGDVQGQRPYSAIKIAFAIFAVIFVIYIINIVSK
ncbi:MAG TPA: hypothetical protein PLJ42_00750 [Chitinophagales bacterium]|jgi:DNA-directed RNA polymerase subunit RPC12/RpoP|nr:hypothetical protein [Chitinophagales bacterium]MBP6154124.1 hypothetical protein [Chitinophagales bacterium]HQV77004.1 hypothetical protein [Chitinophagales bacterium]HQW77929.1 hypothetical protein [Chitinophagales bacterium]HRB66349.1 hypothetical protein [Chitinophagales bacterium]